MGRYISPNETIITDPNGLDLELTTESNVPVALKDANGRDLELTAQDNAPVALRDANGAELELTTDGSVPVLAMDSTSASVIFKLPIPDKTGLTIAVTATVGSYDIDLTTGHGVIAGDILIILEQAGAPKILSAVVLSVAVDVLTLDTQIPYPFTAAADVLTVINDLNVDGSVTEVTYGVPNPFDVALHITQMNLHMTDATVMDDSKFGGLTALTRGIVFRKANAGATEYIYYWNVKSNGQFGQISIDKAYDPKAPAGVYGFTSQITYGGDDNYGVVISIEPGETLELMIQDDLTGLLSFIATIKGHFNID